MEDLLCLVKSSKKQPYTKESAFIAAMVNLKILSVVLLWNLKDCNRMEHAQREEGYLQRRVS